MTLEIRPVTFRKAKAFVEAHHRHNKAPRGHKFSIGVFREDELVGVAMCGRPIARAFDDGRTLEVNRTCTRGTFNANSKLYGAAWRVAKAMGYLRVITYTQKQETGASLRAVGWIRIKELDPRKSWADSTANPHLKKMRDPQAVGNIRRVLWEIRSERE